MSTAKRKIDNIEYFTVASGQSATEGYGCVLSGADTTVDDAGNGATDVIGVFLETKAAGARVAVAPLAGNTCIPVLVGTGGATRGKLAKHVADGFADAPTLADGDTVTAVFGTFAQSGSAGEFVGMYPGKSMVESV